MRRDVFAANQPPEAVKVHDELFVWTDDMQRTSVCHLDIYHYGKKKFAIAKEIKENTKGPSITNAAETLWLKVFTMFGEMPSFETYDDKTFDRVLVDFEDDAIGKRVIGVARWKPVGTWEDILKGIK